MAAHDLLVSELHQHDEPTSGDALPDLARPEYKEILLRARAAAVACVADRAGLTTTCCGCVWTASTPKT